MYVCVYIYAYMYIFIYIETFRLPDGVRASGVVAEVPPFPMVNCRGNVWQHVATCAHLKQHVTTCSGREQTPQT